MIKFKINGSDVQIPSTWEDLTFGQYLRLFEQKDMTDTISILTGFDREYLLNAKIIGLESLIQCTNFLNTPSKFDTYYPHVGPYKLPANKNGQLDIRLESLAQFEDMRVQMQKVNLKEDVPGFTKAYGKYVAIYLQKIRDGHYTHAKALEMEEEILSFRACEVIAVGQFFFIQLANSLTGTAPTSLPTNQSPKKSKSGLMSSKRSLGVMRSSTGSRGK